MRAASVFTNNLADAIDRYQFDHLVDGVGERVRFIGVTEADAHRAVFDIAGLRIDHAHGDLFRRADAVTTMGDPGFARDAAFGREIGGVHRQIRIDILTGPGFGKIGRASCRERVWHYV